jgi:preprotein translocase subunit SecF
MLEFTRYRRLFYVGSAALLLPGLISLVLPGGLRPSIDFTSGTLMTVRFANPVDQSAVRETFVDLGHPEAIVQRSGEGDFVIRTAPFDQPRAGTTDPGEAVSGRERIERGLAGRHGPFDILSLDQVSPLIAAEIVQYSIMATVAASAFILLYLWWAFRGVSHPWRFGVTAVAALLHDGDRRVGVLGFRELVSSALGELASDGLEQFDLEDDVHAFTVALPRVRVIPIERFDPWTLLG